MSDEKETEQINVEVPKRTKELAKEELEHGGLTRVIRERLSEIAHGAESTKKERLKDQLEELRDERKKLKGERMEIDEQLDVVERKIERAESKLDELRDTESEYEGALQIIEEQMHNDGIRIFVGHGRVRDAAKIGNCTEQDVINDIQQRNPNLPEEQFTEGI